MSTDLALACQGSGLAQRHGPCPCQGVLGTEMPVPWAAGNTAQSSAGARKSCGCLSLAGQLPAWAHIPHWDPLPSPGAPQRQHYQAVGWQIMGSLQQPLASAQRAQLTLVCGSSSSNFIPQKVQEGLHGLRAARWLARKGDRSTNLTYSPAWACSCTGSAGLGHRTPIPQLL